MRPSLYTTAGVHQPARGVRTQSRCEQCADFLMADCTRTRLERCTRNTKRELRLILATLLGAKSISTRLVPQPGCHILPIKLTLNSLHFIRSRLQLLYTAFQLPALLLSQTPIRGLAGQADMIRKSGIPRRTRPTMANEGHCVLAAEQAQRHL